MIDKVKDSEKTLAGISQKIQKEGKNVDESNSELIFDLIKQLSINVETLNLEIRTRNQMRLNTLARRVVYFLFSYKIKSKNWLSLMSKKHQLGLA